MITWAEIRTKYEGLEGGFRANVVAYFLDIKGEETDEVVRGKVVLVSQRSFADHLGIAHQTFNRWVKEFGRPNLGGPQLEDPSPEPACINADVPPREGFVRQVNERLRECLPLLTHLSDETHELIAEDLIETQALIDEIKANLKVSHPHG